MGTLSKAEKILAAAEALTASGKVEFTSEDLVVKAHELFPDDFSLKGYRQFPDSNSVFTQLMGVKAPPIVRGWLEKTGAKQFRLTPKGLHDFGGLDGGPDKVNAAVAISIERKSDEAVGRLMTSDAFELFKQDRREDITFHQFCRFVGLSARDKWQKVAGRLQSVRHLVDEAQRLGEAGHALKVHINRNYTFTADDLRLLSGLYDYLIARFKKEMDQWRSHAT